MPNLTLVIGNKAYSSWSMRPWFLMRQAGIPFTEVRVPLHTPETRARILAHSPSGKVPALHADGVVIGESLAIAEYLAERFPAKRLWPEDLAARGLARSVAAEMHAGFTALRQALPFNCRRCGYAFQRSDAVAADIARVAAIWTGCRRQFGQDGPFLFGPASVADAMFAPVVSRFLTYGVPLTGAAADYAKAMAATPTFRAWVDEALAEAEIIPEFEQVR